MKHTWLLLASLIISTPVFAASSAEVPEKFTFTTLGQGIGIYKIENAELKNVEITRGGAGISFSAVLEIDAVVGANLCSANPFTLHIIGDSSSAPMTTTLRLGALYATNPYTADMRACSAGLLERRTKVALRITHYTLDKPVYQHTYSIPLATRPATFVNVVVGYTAATGVTITVLK
jgi:hypothetical protein